ncbi:hypothetical protein [Actinomadura montaniterrae]|uniref:hypothetical protein n=1 Tax=Actinomadura montaniterrae TaxID=1803903 RepID=UPI00178C5650|nr:hypothetical protein [Actinomadura montaniterrae]
MVANTVPFPVPARRPRPLPRLRRAASRSTAPRPAAPQNTAFRPWSSCLGTLRQWERWIGLGFAAGGVVMVPWMFVLARALPSSTQVSNWSMAWVGLDALIAAGLLGTGILLSRRDPRHGLTAAATGALLTMDAWFDVLTSAPGAERALAVAMAAGLELPLACACAVLAVRALRPAPASVQPTGIEDGQPAPAKPTETDEITPAATNA